MQPVSIASVVLIAGLAASPSLAQQAPTPGPYFVGNPLGLPVNPAADGAFVPISSNVKVFGAIYATESCSYDPERDLIVAPARGVSQAVQENNAFVALINHDGSVNTARWIGVQNPQQRAALQPPLILNEPFGSDIEGGILYMADRDGGTADPADPTKTTPSVAVIRKFSMKTGEPQGEVKIEGSSWINDIEVAPDGTIYASNTGVGGKEPQPDTWQVWKVAPDGQVSAWIQGAPLNQPNGIAFDGDGNVVVVNIGSDEVLTFAAADAKLLKTEKAAQAGNDGIVVLPDGTKYVSSVINGGITKLTPDGTASLIAENIPSAASMCYDAGAEQLVVPMNANNGLAFVSLDQ
ncbi:MAG TPA: SMP-30/gluconolactonase/LRE family protein [Devosia sp.]|jgi:hypothetical protein|uniref:SMP-30/gluconolactonase/LRE family protein n=1 Tax=Devosia sp. TaxID=1871048 RepID=UPI002DDD1069|nr:SMP-30/gluconolactonase/LRE family protein [Devosia sp.]HEV2518399.1 SMP-30/gluconolactonase/LRE family protein [Devosia sp.]